MSPMASQITSLIIVFTTVYSGADQRKHQSSPSLALVRGIQRWPVTSPHKETVTRKTFPFDDVIIIHRSNKPIVDELRHLDFCLSIIKENIDKYGDPGKKLPKSLFSQYYWKLTPCQWCNVKIYLCISLMSIDLNHKTAILETCFHSKWGGPTSDPLLYHILCTTCTWITCTFLVLSIFIDS